MQKSTLPESEVIAVIANYDFSDNADRLKELLSPHVTTLIFDNSSPNPPRSVDRILPNNYYAGLWNAATKEALDRSCPWLLFLTSDIELMSEPSHLVECLEEAIRRPGIGIYTPSVHPDSRAVFRSCFSFDTGRIRECYLIEGFFFLARTAILKSVYPIDLEANRLGWGIDIVTCYECYSRQFSVMVDDRTQIYHPAAVHPLDESQAKLQWDAIMTPASRRFERWARHRAKRTAKWLRFRRTVLETVRRS